MSRFTERHRKALSVLALIVTVLFFLSITVFLGKPLLSLFRDPEVFRTWVEERGFWARILFVGMVVLQVIVALIPGEPLEIAAGIAFGAWEGTLLSLIGIVIGSFLVFQLVRGLGVKFVEVFFPLEKIHSLKFLQNTRRFDVLVFLLMMLPGTPKDLISYFIGLTPMKTGHWLLIVAIARIPSVVTSTVGGDALGTERYGFAIVVFVLTALLSLAGLFLYDRITKKKKQNKTP